MAEFHKPPERTPEQLLPLCPAAGEITPPRTRTDQDARIYRFPKRALHRSRPPDQQLQAPLGGRRWRVGPRRRTISSTTTCDFFGFGLKAEVLKYPGGMHGDIGFFLTWK